MSNRRHSVFGRILMGVTTEKDVATVLVYIAVGTVVGALIGGVVIWLLKGG